MKYDSRKSLFSQLSVSSFRSDRSENSLFDDTMDGLSLGEGGSLFPSRENSRDLIYNQSEFRKRSGKSNPDQRQLRFESIPESDSDSKSHPGNQGLENMQKKFSFHM